MLHINLCSTTKDKVCMLSMSIILVYPYPSPYIPHKHWGGKKKLRISKERVTKRNPDGNKYRSFFSSEFVLELNKDFYFNSSKKRGKPN